MKRMNSLFFLMLLTAAVSTWMIACGDEPSDDDPQSSDPRDSDTSPGGGGTDTAGLLEDNSPVADLSSLVGKTYILDFIDDFWTEPTGYSEDIGGSTPTFVMEFRTVDAAVGTTAAFTAAVGTSKNGAQDMCNQTYIMNGTITSTPGSPTTFTMGPADNKAIVEGPENKAMTMLHGFTLGGQFFDQGVSIKKGLIVAELDARDVYPLFTVVKSTNGQELCDGLHNLGLDCQPCSFETTASLCLTVKAEYFKVYEAPLLDIQDVAAFDATCCPGCTM